MQLGSGSLTAPRPARRPPWRRSALPFLASSAPFFGGHRTRSPGAVSPTIFNRLWENLSPHDSLLKAPDKGQKRGSEASSAQQAPGDTVRPSGCASPPDCRGFGHAARSSHACEDIHRVRRIRTRSRATWRLSKHLPQEPPPLLEPARHRGFGPRHPAGPIAGLLRKIYEVNPRAEQSPEPHRLLLPGLSIFHCASFHRSSPPAAGATARRDS